MIFLLDSRKHLAPVKSFKSCPSYAGQHWLPLVFRFHATRHATHRATRPNLHGYEDSFLALRWSNWCKYDLPPWQSTRLCDDWLAAPFWTQGTELFPFVDMEIHFVTSAKCTAGFPARYCRSQCIKQIFPVYVFLREQSVPHYSGRMHNR